MHMLVSTEEMVSTESGHVLPTTKRLVTEEERPGATAETPAMGTFSARIHTGYRRRASNQKVNSHLFIQQVFTARVSCSTSSSGLWMGKFLVLTLRAL